MLFTPHADDIVVLLIDMMTEKKSVFVATANITFFVILNRLNYYLQVSYRYPTLKNNIELES